MHGSHDMMVHCREEDPDGRVGQPASQAGRFGNFFISQCIAR